MDEMVITAPLSRPLFQQAQSASVLSGQNLTLAIEPSLGQTLARMPGVSSSYFGPASSRPARACSEASSGIASMIAETPRWVWLEWASLPVTVTAKVAMPL